VDLLEQESATASNFLFSLFGPPRLLLPLVRASFGSILVAARAELLLFTIRGKKIERVHVSRLRILQSLVLFLSRRIKNSSFSSSCCTLTVGSRLHTPSVS
jgi:hypothetical protein